MADNIQELRFGDIEIAPAESRPDDILYFLSGKKMYEIGEVSGKYPPIGWRRPGFLAGKRIAEIGPEDPRRPQGAAHLLREMGGIWAHPVKAVESLYFSIDFGSEHWLLSSSDRFVSHFAYAEFFFERNGLSVTRTDFVHEDEPMLFIDLRIVNRSNKAVRLRLNLDVEFNLMPSWFSGWANGEDIVFYKDGLLFAYDKFWAGQWGAVCGSSLTPSGFIIGRTVADPKVSGERKTVNTLYYDLSIGPNKDIVIPFGISAESRKGYAEAHRRFSRLIGKGEAALKDKISLYETNVSNEVQFQCSDDWFSMAYKVAKANLMILVSDLSPFLGSYLFAGVPEYIQLFGTDTAYSIPGIVASGFHEVAREALSQLGFKASTQCGRVPHEVTTNGRIFHPGNTQETSQFALACWSYFKWTGDRSFLEWVYPLVQEGVLDYSPAHWDADLDYYLDGNSMVERPGMADEKLDSVSYFDRAIYVLADMAEALGRPIEGARWRELAESLREAINVDWWMEDESVFADSLEEDHTPRLDGHWIVAVPMEVDVADRDKGERSLERIWKDWVWIEDKWGLVHTREKENLVWTLPTGILAMAEFLYGHVDRGVYLIRNIARTMEYGALGTFKELIPEGLSFVQLWSVGMFLQGVIEGIFRLEARADIDKISLRPRLPSDWGYARLSNLRVGNHRISINLEKAKKGIPGKATMTHDVGESALIVNLELPVERQLPVTVADNRAMIRKIEHDARGGVIRLEFTLDPGQRAEINLSEQEIKIAKHAVTRTRPRGKA